MLFRSSWTVGTDGTYSRRYSNGIAYYNPTTEQGWFVSERQVNKIRLSALVYGGPGAYANITINDGQVYQISNSLLFSAEWVNITLNNTELANTGKFSLKSWSTTVNGITYWWDVVSGKGRNSYYSTDSGSTFTVYDEDKNWMFNLYMNESRTIAVDDLSVTQTNKIGRAHV